MSKRVVITGAGAITPVGNDVDSTWQALIAGQSGIRRISSFDPSDLQTQIAGEVQGFDPVERFGRREARRMDRVTQLAMEACAQAISSSQLLEECADRDRMGVVIGTALGGYDTLLDQFEVLRTRGPSRISPFCIPMLLVDTPASRASIEYGLHGPNVAVVSACATGSDAVGVAFDMVTQGTADAILAGGCEAALPPVIIAGFNAMGALSTRNHEPARASRPFDAQRDGFVPGEGAAILVLEEMERARARGATIYAEMVGYAATSDAHHIAAPLENADYASLVMQQALKRASLAPSDIDYINAHGTSTPLNDIAETRAIKATMDEHAHRIPISSTKSMTGHLLGAGGALEALVCVKVVQEGIIPPTTNYETPDPGCDLDYVPNQARQVDVKVAMSNSFGFGGHNACIIVRRYQD